MGGAGVHNHRQLRGVVSGYPNYTLFGYRCRGQGSYTACATNFYVSQKTQRLESFQTTSPQFVLFGGVRVGMSADAASAREHEPDVPGADSSYTSPRPGYRSTSGPAAAMSTRAMAASTSPAARSRASASTTHTTVSACSSADLSDEQRGDQR